MSDLQDQFDKGAITRQEFSGAWDKEVKEKERLHPGIHDRLFAKLRELYPGKGVDADEFFRE